MNAAESHLIWSVLHFGMVVQFLQVIGVIFPVHMVIESLRANISVAVSQEPKSKILL